MTYNRPTDGLDKDARLHVEGVKIVEKEKQQGDSRVSRTCQEGRHGRCSPCETIGTHYCPLDV